MVTMQLLSFVLLSTLQEVVHASSSSPFVPWKLPFRNSHLTASSNNNQLPPQHSVRRLWSLIQRGGASTAQNEESNALSKKKKKKAKKPSIISSQSPSDSPPVKSITTKTSTTSSTMSNVAITKDPFPSVAQFVTLRLEEQAKRIKESSSSSLPRKSSKESVEAIVQALHTLGLAQQAFKGLDGVAHEAYQRSSNSKKRNVVTTSVRGRAQRSAQRTSATATALEACEFCELLEQTMDPSTVPPGDDNGKVPTRTTTTTTNERIEAWAQQRGYLVLYLNTTSPELQIQTPSGTTQLGVLVLYDPLYRGGAGADHASIEDLYAAPVNETSSSPRGKVIIILGNGNDHLIHLLQVLDQPPLTITTATSVPSASGKAVSNTATAKPTTVSVQPRLYRTAGKLLQLLQPVLQQHQQELIIDQKENDDKEPQQSNQTNTTSALNLLGKQPIAIHLVGRSLAGGVACLAAAMLDGTLPLPSGEGRSKKTRSKNSNSDQSNTTTTDAATLAAWAKGRCSATVLGCPPCLSPNVPVPFVTSILLGDDIACRTTFASLERMTARVIRHTAGQDSWWHKVAQPTAALTDALSMTVSSLKTAATASSAANDPTRLVVSGHAYLIRPRRLGAEDGAGSSSIHEVALGSGHKSSRREALRAAVLWQLDDIMLSNSLWKHHRLESYIHGLDRVQLRGVDENNDGEAKEEP